MPARDQGALLVRPEGSRGGSRPTGTIPPMIILLTIVHVTVCVFLILVVLLQTGKGADLQGAFGGGGSQTAFGARGATTLLHKLTTAAAVLFMATSLILAIRASRAPGSLVEEPEAPIAQPAGTPGQEAPLPPPDQEAAPEGPEADDAGEAPETTGDEGGSSSEGG